MNTKLTTILGAILFAAASFSPVAMAKPGSFDFPRKSDTSPRKPAAVHCYSSACAGISCCVTRTKTEFAPNGKGMITRRVRACTSECPVPVSQHKAVCRVGSRA
ncbi:MAG: hypothetical protein KF712_13890 [Akkermansiaceae bacterium]|nr:hypothetical protein [Akkermansiaceae bacterium]